MLLRIDPASTEPLFAQIGGQVRALIARGQRPAGSRLPPARELATSLDVNLHTVLRAYQDLRDEGLLELRRGRGAVVAATRDRTELQAAINSLVRTARSLGVPPATTISLVKEALR